jgi:adenylosuccinate lyase
VKLELEFSGCQLGLTVIQQQIDEMKQYIDAIKSQISFECEREIRHDVVARIHAFGEQCFNA